MKSDQFFEENFIFSRSWDIVNQFIWKKNNQLTRIFLNIKHAISIYCLEGVFMLWN